MDNSTVVETGGNVDGTEHDGVSLSLSLAGNSDNENNESMKNDSASSRKIETILCSTPSSSEPITGYRFMNMELLDTVFSALLCPECMTSSLKLKENMSMKKGLASCLYIKCMACGHVHQFCNSTRRDLNFDINVRTVYAMRACGQGFAGLSTFVSLMDMPKPMTANNYDKIVNKLTDAAKYVAEETMKDACEELRLNTNAGDILDTAVSCDGTWQRRGYSSNNGVVSIISVKTGKILDIEAMNKVCKACGLKEHLKYDDPLGYAEWKEFHICSFNYQGSAGGMEPEGARRIWSRSIKTHKLRYNEFYGDGDSKGYEAVKNTYEGLQVQKLECVGHVQKRVGTRLRALKRRCKELGGRGKLTDATIDRLQNYYGIAIRQNKNDLQGMRSAVRATLFHVASNKSNNFHYPHCPEGPDSWCRHNRDKANKTTTYKPGPGLPTAIVLKLKPMYEELSCDKLLKKCLHGLTQNSNESYNMTVWERIPKNHYVSLSHLRFGAYDAAANFNIGRKASVLVMEKMGLRPGRYLLKGCQRLNRKRLYLSEYKNTASSKKRRKVIRGKKKARDDKNLQTEGEQYKTGAF